MITQEFIEENLPEASDYQRFLLTWIIDIGIRNKESFNYNNIKDIAIGIYLLCKDLKLDPTVDNNKFIKYFNDRYGYGSLIHKLILDIVNNDTDLLDLVSDITDKDYCNKFMSYSGVTSRIKTLYNNEKLSEEENRETLVFGDNILNGEMSVRELSDTVRMMTLDYVGDYITTLNLGEITFNISENSIMYLKDTDGIKLATINIKDGGDRTVIRYTNEHGSALFLLFEPRFIKTETIYGLSLDVESDEERGLLILEKDKDESVYKFLFGRSDI